MERRPYFVIGDLAANVLVAAVAAALATWLFGGEPGMFAGMVGGMVLGMALALVLSMVLLVPLLGAMEVMSPCMLSGMFAGMVGGMWPLAVQEVLAWGGGIGAAVFAAIYGLNALMGGPQQLRG